MYLSQLILNPRARMVRADLSRPYQLHQVIMSGFFGCPEGERVLYRLDLSSRDGIPRLLVKSDSLPDWSRLAVREDYLLKLPAGNPQVRIYDPQVRVGQRLAFRLLANPTRSQPAEQKQPGEKRKRGKRVSIGREEDQAAWLAHKAGDCGFRLHTLRLANLGPQVFNIRRDEHETHAVRFWAVRFDGELDVTDPDAFLGTLQQGIGSAKGFGYGLLSIAPLA
ncbi:MAG: type I-E CRISPR-associated protein Cas6/Cse3/CasE [Anaerolineaceae bacterium]|nr:type I-E CRISPR-associated protein Cas6/Cse3/CasE [Anaerolineaceae bacterium]